MSPMVHPFTQLLLAWNASSNTRTMPWKGEKDPYRIWLSEVILQQTRVEQGRDYYLRFLHRFPTVQDLAAAADADVFKLWEGLGYYARCRNLLHTARHIVTVRKGIFPDTYEDILALKGIGAYTAAAIASFAFGLPRAVVDGNVMRVMARVFGIHEAVDSTGGKKAFSELASTLLDQQSPGVYNQAIMDFGAVVCKPLAPLCQACPLSGICQAFAAGQVAALPYKAKQLVRKKRWFYYLLAEQAGKILIRERPAGDIWRHLYEFVLVESPGKLGVRALRSMALPADWQAAEPRILEISAPYRQVLTHQEINGRFIRISLAAPFASPPGYTWVPKTDLQKFAFPKFILSYLSENR